MNQPGLYLDTGEFIPAEDVNLAGTKSARQLGEELKILIAAETGITGGSMHARINRLVA